MRRWMTIGAVAGSYTLLVGFLVIMVVAITAAVSDGWKLRQSAEKHADSAPRFSPDGSRIAFIRRTGGAPQLWLMADDGSDAHPVGRADRFAWTAKGSLLLARGRRLFSVSADGGVPAAAGRGTLRAGAGGVRNRDRRVFARGAHIYVRTADGRIEELT